jgi:hypothetical protein
MSDLSIRFHSFRLTHGVSRRQSFARVIAAVSVAAATPAFAADAGPSAGAAAAAASPAAPAAALPATPPAAAIKTVRCENQTLHVEWSGEGVNAVDYYSSGEPFLQARRDPSPAQTSLDISLDKPWDGRKVDVRLFDKSAKLLDSKSVDCGKAS